MTKVKNLELGEVLFPKQGSFALRTIYFVFGLATMIFFRRIELVNSQNVSDKSSLIFVMNHPNGLIDPLLVFLTLPRKVSFLAKSTIFKMPILGFIARTVEALPVYRQSEASQEMTKNQETFYLCRQKLKEGGAIALFPEGVSHSTPRLLPLKTGAARIALGAVSVGKNPESLDLKIVPVGIFYTNKTTFRSEAMLCFGEPFKVYPVELNQDGEPLPHFVKELTEKISKTLKNLTINAESENELETAKNAEEVFSSVYEIGKAEQTLWDKFEFLQNFAEKNEETSLEGEKLEKKLSKYQKKLDKLGIEPENLALPQYSVWYAIKYVFNKFGLLAMVFPLAIIGAVLHFPAYQACRLLAYFLAKEESKDIASTVKILAGMVFMPLSWLVLAIFLLLYVDWKAAVLSVPIAFFCGYLALKTLEEINEIRGWINITVIFLARRKKFLRLLAERQKLHRQLKKFD